MGICPKVNVLARLELELTHDDSAIPHFNHYTTRTPTVGVCLGDLIITKEEGINVVHLAGLILRMI